MKYTKRITTAIATGAILVNALAPVAFAQDLTVGGNGAFSDNAVNVSTNNSASVNQSNNANVTNKVSSNANSGDNSSKFNTGGTSNITTGNATSNTAINNALNANQATLSNCGACAGGATDVNVSKNGAYSDSNVGVNSNNAVSLNQNNNADVKNYIDANANTGKNDSKYNTGGNTSVNTGAAVTVANVTTNANANVATIGGSNGTVGGSKVTIGGSNDVDGNGAFSDNNVALNQNSAVVLSQDNTAHVKNVIDANSNSGKNDSKFNTGGNNGITTGVAGTVATVDNAVNFNLASVDCDCVLGGGLDVAIEGNGAKSLSEVGSSLNNALFNSQDNSAGLFNDVDGKAKSGSNDSGFGTGGNNNTTAGDSLSATTVNNTGGVNVLNDGSSIQLPGNWNMGVNFDLSGLMSSLNHWMTL